METKERLILEQSRQLIFKFGVKSLTMDDIAQQLRISKKTLYQYFENKNDLINKVIELTNSDFESFSCDDDYHNYNAIEVLLRNLKFVLEMIKHINPVLDFELKKYYPECFSKLEEHRTSRMGNKISKNLQQGLEQGFYRAELNVELITFLFLAQLGKVMDGESFENKTHLMPQIVFAIHIYHLRGVCNEKGLAELDRYLIENPIHI